MVTREMKDAVNHATQCDEDYLPDAGYAFYHRCLFDHKLCLIDADEYAILNTLIGYDIGVDSALAIAGYLWAHDIERLELTGNDKDKAEVQKAIDVLGLDIKLDKWRYGKVECYEYYEE